MPASRMLALDRIFQETETVLELIAAGGWVMVPIILCSILALAIIGERIWALQTRRVRPARLVGQVWHQVKSGTLDAQQLRKLRQGSSLGRVLAAGLTNMRNSRQIMMDAIEDAGRHEAQNLERFLNTLGTIASITPLLGLLGTVIGMIRVFTTITQQGVGNASALAGGISEALLTTAAGLMVAIPSLMAYRYFRGLVDNHLIAMEQEAMKLVEVIQGQRERGSIETPGGGGA